MPKLAALARSVVFHQLDDRRIDRGHAPREPRFSRVLAECFPNSPRITGRDVEPQAGGPIELMSKRKLS
jgi:hypothetical protein